MDQVQSGAVRALTGESHWERSLLIFLILLAPLVAFYNLENNPRPWQDEGTFLSVPKTLAQEGVYATRSSEGYQTYGAVQSVGPTVLLPVALSFKILGVGLTQGRIVAGIYLLFTLLAFLGLAREMYGLRVAVVATVLLIGSSQFLWVGRQLLGEIPALGLFLAGWYVFLRAARPGSHALCAVAGLLVGAAMVTKAQFVAVGFAALGLVAVLDLVFYRSGNFKRLVITGVLAFACVATWQAWQWLYFGAATYQKNAANLSQLMAISTGFSPSRTVEAVKYLFGAELSHFYYLWGFPALAYAAVLSARRNVTGLVTANLLAFTLIWLGIFLFWIIPWPEFVYAPMGIAAIFVAKLLNDLTDDFGLAWRHLASEIKNGRPGKSTFNLTLLIMVFLLAGYSLQGNIRQMVLDRGQGTSQMQSPHEVAGFLDATVDRKSVVETWERELGILTAHNYHFPDQSVLSATRNQMFDTYRSSVSQQYVLGAAYFEQVRPDYVVVGWFARRSGLYDVDFLTRHGCLLKTIGDGDLRYEVYQVHLDGSVRCS